MGRFIFCLLVGVLMTVQTNNVLAEEEKIIVAEVQTNRGNFTLKLFPKAAPESVKNFISYTNKGFYDGTIFHRVIKDFVIQAGGMTPDMKLKPTDPPIKNESDNGLHNSRKTVAMARTNNPDSASSQFFINLKNNFNLNYFQGNWGYTVFAEVIDGMDVVDKISQVETENNVNGNNDVPKEPVIIEKVTIQESKLPWLVQLKNWLQKFLRKNLIPSS